jgi:hypothetical protein
VLGLWAKFSLDFKPQPNADAFASLPERLAAIAATLDVGHSTSGNSYHGT